MNDLGPLAERLKKVEDGNEEQQATEPRLDGRVLEKVITALEARLSEHISQVDRRIAQMDAKVALDLHAAEREILSQGGAFAKAIEQIQGDLRKAVEAAQQHSAEQVAGVDQKIGALQESLPAKFREIIEAVRQSMEARMALELKEMEMRIQSRGVSAEALGDVESKLAALREELPSKIRQMVDASIGGLPQVGLGALEQKVAELQQSIPAVEAKLTTLRDELPPKIRQIVEAVEASMQTRLAASENAAAARFQEHTNQVSAVDQKLALLQAELPPKLKAIVDSMRQSFETKMAAELKALEERNREQMEQAGGATGLREQLDGALRYISLLESRIQALEHNTQSNFEEAADRAAERVWRSLESRLEQRAAPSGPPSQMISELRQKSSSAEQSVLDLIAGIGHLFDSPAAPVEAPGAEPEPDKIEPGSNSEPGPEDPMRQAGAAEEAPPLEPEIAEEPSVEGQSESKPPVIFFKPKEPDRKWRIPFVSSFFLMTLVLAWLQFTSG